MRSLLLLAVITLLALPATAEPISKPAGQGAMKRLPLKSTSPNNSCAAFGPGFVMVEGTGTCIKIGGATQIGVGASVGR